LAEYSILRHPERMTDRSSHNERLRDELHKQYSRLSSQQTAAWGIVIVSGLLFVSNFLGADEPTNRTLGGLTLMGIAGGGIWLHTLRGELARNLRRSLENSRELDASRRAANE
jgi:hypothetical protein